MFDLESFASTLLKENKHIPKDIDLEVLEQMRDNLLDTIDDHINAMIIAELSPTKSAEFDKLLDATDDEDKMSAFLVANIPNLDTKLTQLLVEFRKTYLGL